MNITTQDLRDFPDRMQDAVIGGTNGPAMGELIHRCNWAADRIDWLEEQMMKIVSLTETDQPGPALQKIYKVAKDSIGF